MGLNGVAFPGDIPVVEFWESVNPEPCVLLWWLPSFFWWCWCPCRPLHVRTKQSLNNFLHRHRNTKLTALLFFCETGNPDLMCRTKYPANYCRKDVGPGWFQYGPNRCVRSFHNLRMKFNNAEVIKTNTDSTCDLILFTQSHHFIRRSDERGGSCIYGHEKSNYSQV